MQTKLKLSAILLTLLLAILSLTGIAANARTLGLLQPTFGLYCENQSAEIDGKVKYVIDQYGNAVQYSEYTVNGASGGALYIPFVSNAYELPEIDLTVNSKPITVGLCYGENYANSGGLRFYSSDIREDITGTLYTLTTEDKSLTVDFKTYDEQNFIYFLPYNQCSKTDSGKYTYTLEEAKPTTAYAIYAINGDFESLESNADIQKERLTLKEYIDRNYNELDEYYSGFGKIEIEFFYSLANEMMENDKNYEFFDFFFGSISERHINAYQIELPTDAEIYTIAYSMSVGVRQDNAVTPAIYCIEQTATGNYRVDYTIELNGNFPYIIESSESVQKQDDYVYTVENVTDHFSFVFGTVQTAEISASNSGNDRGTIIFIVILCVVVCAVVVFGIFMLLRYKRAKAKNEE